MVAIASGRGNAEKERHREREATKRADRERQKETERDTIQTEDRARLGSWSRRGCGDCFAPNFLSRFLRESVYFTS